jgi:glycopeptide antibiotics resistance protein
MLVAVLFMCSVIGYMVRLPRIFSKINMELHAAFYFGAILVLSVLFPKKWGVIAVLLTLFGVFIEVAQHYSNKISIRLIGKRIHGNFDPFDIAYNVLGLCIGLVVFHSFRLVFKRN